MNGPEHYREAERRLLMAWEEDSTPERNAHLVAEAQVHATLALAAAAALSAPDRGASVTDVRSDRRAWEQAAGVQPDPLDEIA